MREDIKTAYDSLHMDQESKRKILDNLLSQCEDSGKETIIMRRKHSKLAVAAAAAIIFACVPIGATAAYHYLSADVVAEKLGSHELSKFFSTNDVIETCERGDYRFIYFGNASASLKNEFLTDGAATYVALAVERIDGNPITEDESFVAAPLIQGLDPANYNIYSMGGSAAWKIIDGIRYMIMSTESLEAFSDKTVYLSITTGPDYAEGYSFDKESGLITANPEFNGINALFTLKLDSKKADAEAQAEFVEKIDSPKEDLNEEPSFGTGDYDYLWNFDYSKLTDEAFNKLTLINGVKCLADDTCTSDANGNYNVSIDHEYGGISGFSSKGNYPVNEALFSLFCLSDEDGYAIIQREYRDANDVLHISQYLFREDTLGSVVKVFKGLN